MSGFRLEIDWKLEGILKLEIFVVGVVLGVVNISNSRNWATTFCNC